MNAKAVPRDSIDLYDFGAPTEEWVKQAACASPDVDPNLFHPTRYSTDDRIGGHHFSPATVEAKKICGACPVRLECLQYALKEPMWDGIYGGLTPRERRLLVNQTQERKGIRRRKWMQCEDQGHTVWVDNGGYTRCRECVREAARIRRAKLRDGRPSQRPADQGHACGPCRHRRIRCKHIVRES